MQTISTWKKDLSAADGNVITVLEVKFKSKLAFIITNGSFNFEKLVLVHF